MPYIKNIISMYVMLIRNFKITAFFEISILAIHKISINYRFSVLYMPYIKNIMSMYGMLMRNSKKTSYFKFIHGIYRFKKKMIVS